eukprot:7718286-Karenia_brevis.AAC.2
MEPRSAQNVYLRLKRLNSLGADYKLTSTNLFGDGDKVYKWKWLDDGQGAGVWSGPGGCSDVTWDPQWS